MGRNSSKDEQEINSCRIDIILISNKGGLVDFPLLFISASQCAERNKTLFIQMSCAVLQ